MVIIIFGGLLLGFWGLAVIMHVCGKYAIAKIEKRKAACVGETTATVQEIKKVRTRMGDDYTYTWYPIYEYYVNGEPVVQKSEFGGNKDTFQQGQQVILYYNPDNPNEIYVPEENAEASAKVFRLVGNIFIVIGFVIIIVIIVLLVMGIL